MYSVNFSVLCYADNSVFRVDNEDDPLLISVQINNECKHNMVTFTAMFKAMNTSEM